MLVIEKRCADSERIDERLVLPFDLRQKSRLRTTLASGAEVGLFLERGTILRDGDCLLANDGRIVKVEAKPEAVFRVTAHSAQALARAAYHLGNRHVQVEIGAGLLRLASDAVLKEMLLQLDVEVAEELAPFEPEAGAYASHQHE
jgi:urease accessory protein